MIHEGRPQHNASLLLCGALAACLLAGCATSPREGPPPLPRPALPSSFDLRAELEYSATPEVAALALPLSKLRAHDRWLLSMYLRRPSAGSRSERIRRAGAAFGNLSEKLKGNAPNPSVQDLLMRCGKALALARQGSSLRGGALREAGDTAAAIRARLAEQPERDTAALGAVDAFRVLLNEARSPLKRSALGDAELRELTDVVEDVEALTVEVMSLSAPFAQAGAVPLRNADQTKAFLLAAHVRLCAYRSALIACHAARRVRRPACVRWLDVVTMRRFEEPTDVEFRKARGDAAKRRAALAEAIQIDAQRRADLDRLRCLAASIPPSPSPGLEKAAVEMGAPPDFFEREAGRDFVTVLNDRAVIRFVREALDEANAGIRQLEQDLDRQ